MHANYTILVITIPGFTTYLTNSMSYIYLNVEKIHQKLNRRGLHLLILFLKDCRRIQPDTNRLIVKLQTILPIKFQKNNEKNSSDYLNAGEGITEEIGGD